MGRMAVQGAGEREEENSTDMLWDGQREGQRGWDGSS